jgi:hypothetical protein
MCRYETAKNKQQRQQQRQLDAAHGSEVVDPSIFRAHAAKYEVRLWRAAAGYILLSSSSSSSTQRTGSELVDPSIFRAHAAKYEVRL